MKQFETIVFTSGGYPTMELITVRKYATAFDAELARRVLESHGIHAVISGDAIGFIGGVLQVAESDKDRAVELLENAVTHEKDAAVGPAWQESFCKIVFWSIAILVGLVAAGILISSVATWFGQ
ncbi:MAG: DUF2007 domain-containing protein [Planctomycetes bacterium]|nr:DUF2007 domain-containing protein [Planctomycetota bacterium]